MNVDPFRGFNFRVEIDGVTEAGFQECGGLDANTEAVEYREGTDPNHVRKLTGLNTFSPVTLRRGITNSAELWAWQQTAAAGQTDRRNVSVVLVDEAGDEQIRWNLRRAWPSKWAGPSFNATANDVAVEELELCHEELVRA